MTALHLVAGAGLCSTHFSQPGLYGWDLETVFWLNPRVSEGGSNG